MFRHSRNAAVLKQDWYTRSERRKLVLVRKLCLLAHVRIQNIRCDRARALLQEPWTRYRSVQIKLWSAIAYKPMPLPARLVCSCVRLAHIMSASSSVSVLDFESRRKYLLVGHAGAGLLNQVPGVSPFKDCEYHMLDAVLISCSLQCPADALRDMRQMDTTLSFLILRGSKFGRSFPKTRSIPIPPRSSITLVTLSLLCDMKLL